MTVRNPYMASFGDSYDARARRCDHGSCPAGFCHAEQIDREARERGQDAPEPRPRDPSLDQTRDPDLLDAKEVASLLAMDVKSVYAGARNKEIPCRRVGARYLFSRAGLASWLREYGHE